MRVNEIFYSLQGEGHFTGTPAVFLRLSGCNLSCDFCDTQHKSSTDMFESDIIAEVSKYPARHIVITGGEPTLQLTQSLIEGLHAEGFFVQIETNGTQATPTVDWVTCSPKEHGTLNIQHIDELKVLFWGQDVSQYETMQVQCHSLQPLDTGNEERNKEIITQTINYIQNNPIWKLSLQTHKILNVR